MIVDDVDGFLKFLDKVSLQLAYLLDLDGRQTDRQQIQPQQQDLADEEIHKAATTRSNKDRRLARSKQNGAKQSSKKKLKDNKSLASKRGKMRRKDYKGLSPKGDDDSIKTDKSSSQLASFNHHINHHQTVQPIGEQQQQQQHHQTHQELGQLHANKQLQLSLSPGNNPEVTGLDEELALSIADVELRLDEQNSSISPVTHLSPMDTSIHFNGLSQSQYYSPVQRGHPLDNYDFSSHDPIALSANGMSNQGQQQQRTTEGETNDLHQRQQQTLLPVDLQHPSTTTSLSGRAGETIVDRSSLNSSQNDCYIDHHQASRQGQQPQQHQQHHNQQMQYHLDQPGWLGPTSHTNDGTLHLGMSESTVLVGGSLSPAAHQTLDQVHFNTPLYHQSYYSHQCEQLDSFHHINDDFSGTTTSIGADHLTAPIACQIHRIQVDSQSQQSRQQQQQQHQQHHQSIRMSNNEMNNGNSRTNSFDQQHLHTQHHQAHQNQSNMRLINNDYLLSHQNHSHHQQQQPQQQTHHHHSQQQHQSHHHNHQVMPMISGLESSGVIIQDINLAAASWSSPEDLYSI